MERDNRQTALRLLIEIVAKNGYITFDDIMRCADDCALSIGDFDWLSEAAHTRNIIIYDEAPKPVLEVDDDDYEDFAQKDYEETYSEVIELCADLEPLIKEIRSIMPPQRGEVLRLKYQIKEGNIHARNRMIEMYLRQAIRIALQRTKTYDLDIEETIGDAFTGLIMAVDRYDPDSSGPFTSFASLWIYQNISREQNTRNPNMYFPVHRKELYYTMYPAMKNRGCAECEKVYQCDKATEMICEKIGCDKVQARDVIMAIMPIVSLDGLIEEDSADRSLLYSDDEIIEVIDERLKAENIYNTLERLDERQRNILILRYGLDGGRERSLEEVGQKYGLTRERIRQIEAKALRKMAAYLRYNSKRPRRGPPCQKSKLHDSATGCALTLQKNGGTDREKFAPLNQR